jgi:hypothetical protein
MTVNTKGIFDQLGNIDINAIIALAKQARDQGRGIVDDLLSTLREQLRSHPQAAAILGEFERLFGPLLKQGPSDAEIDAARDRWQKGFAQDVHDLPKQPTPPAGFPYMEPSINAPDRSRLTRGDEIYERLADGAGPHSFIVWGRIGARPNDTWPAPGGWQRTHTMP